MRCIVRGTRRCGVDCGDVACGRRGRSFCDELGYVQLASTMRSFKDCTSRHDKTYMNSNTFIQQKAHNAMT
jgi:hypothetical protein